MAKPCNLLDSDGMFPEGVQGGDPITNPLPVFLKVINTCLPCTFIEA
jgi:hypothetical protein